MDTELNLAEELARQTLLLDFISECAALDSVPALMQTISVRLHWIASYESCTVSIIDDTGTHWWGVPRDQQAHLLMSTCVLPEPWMSVHERTASSLLVTLQAGEEESILGLPIGGPSTAMGTICLGRAQSRFSHSDVRHLRHASNAVGVALSRIAGVQSERQTQKAIELVESQARAMAEDRALLAEQMVGIVSHDLRNPLSAILTGARLLGRNGALPTRTDRVLEHVVGAAQRAQRLIDELLDFTLARVGGGLRVNRREVNLHALVSRSVEELSLTFNGRELLHDEVGTAGASIDGDRIEQLIGNLVSNAMSYGDESQPAVVVSGVQDGMVHLAVSNRGIPIPVELQQSLFEPMVRGSTSQSSGRSVGLGLFIVRAIARAHGGDVKVKSDDDGTTFIVSFPAR